MQGIMSRIAFNWAQGDFGKMILRQQEIMYCLLLKMTEIQFRMKGRSPVAKTAEMIAFMDRELATLFGRELLVAARFFQLGSKLEFFRKVQKNRVDLPKTLKNMAWDLWHIRQVEMGLSFRPDHGARYHFPAILTFDKGLGEIIDLCSLSMCIMAPDRTMQPIYTTDARTLLSIDDQHDAVTSFEQAYDIATRAKP
ncbi:MAG: hypothetical protein ACRYG8_51605 [Janthinobacterium lividum]